LNISHGECCRVELRSTGQPRRLSPHETLGQKSKAGTWPAFE
jgi:hypothetical protein